ncbi:MAG TPA: hypothetical protein VK891_13370 [Euzebyales bacterium]|nr:hypothetical protein [Euzebyales bacterium]
MPESTEPTGTPVSFAIDGRPFQTAEPRRPAAEILRLADLDPGQFDLAELRGQRPEPVRFTADELVQITEGARFVAIRRRADIA